MDPDVMTRGFSRERAGMPEFGMAPLHPQSARSRRADESSPGPAKHRERLATGIPLVDASVTWLTGKPLQGQQPLVRLNGVQKALVNVLALVGVWAVFLPTTQALPDVGAWLLILLPVWLALLVTLAGRLRAMQVELGHHAVHGEVSRKKWVNVFFAHIATVTALAQNPVDYLDDHNGRHHRMKFFTTLLDPDAAFLYRLGFRPGMTRRQLYRTLWKTIFSPAFHWAFLSARARSAFVTASMPHRLGVLAWIAILGGFAMMLPTWVFVVAVLLPMFPLYHVSALLQFLTEHRWMTTAGAPKGRADFASRCVGRFALVAPPKPGLTGFMATVAWAAWGVRMIPEVFFRLGVIVGDMSAHDQHHLAVSLGQDSRNWPEAIYDRQRAIDAGDELGLAEREVYGIKAALDWVFDGYAGAQPIEA